MKRKSIFALLAIVFIGAGVLQSCKTDSATSTPTEFVADNTTFSGFTSYPVGATLHGANPTLGPMAHGGQDTSVTRKVHYKNNQDRVNGKFPIGTVIVKQSTSPKGMNEITAMVKRGNNFNPTAGDWEFFMLMPSGEIATDANGPLRGANLLNGMCAGCHTGAAAKDYIFTK